MILHVLLSHSAIDVLEVDQVPVKACCLLLMYQNIPPEGPTHESTPSNVEFKWLVFCYFDQFSGLLPSGKTGGIYSCCAQVTLGKPGPWMKQGIHKDVHDWGLILLCKLNWISQWMSMLESDINEIKL